MIVIQLINNFHLLGFDSRRGLGIIFLTTASRTALGPIQPPIQWIPGALSLWVNRPRREAEHSSPSSAEVKKPWSYTSTLQYAFMAWCSDEAQGQIYLYINSYLLQLLLEYFMFHYSTIFVCVAIP